MVKILVDTLDSHVAAEYLQCHFLTLNAPLPLDYYVSQKEIPVFFSSTVVTDFVVLADYPIL